MNPHLRDFPLTKQVKNGKGILFRQDLSDTSNKPYIDQGVQWCRDLGITSAHVMGQDWLMISKAAAKLAAAGIPSTNRLIWKINKPVDYIDGLKRFQALGLDFYPQIFNEPGDEREWRPDKKGDIHIDLKQFAASWADNAIAVFDAGGYPGVGAVLGEDEWLLVYNAVMARGRGDIWPRVWWCLHNYGSNHPLSYPYDDVNQNGTPVSQAEYNASLFSMPIDEVNALRHDTAWVGKPNPRNLNERPHHGQTVVDDDTTALRFLAMKVWMERSPLGYCLPILGGESGWPYGAEDDHRYSKIMPRQHAAYHVALYDQFRTGVCANGEPLPDELLNMAPWALADVGADSWYYGPLGTKQLLVDAVAAMPAYSRRFSWDAPVDHTCPAGQHWDDAAGKCLDDVIVLPPPPPPTRTASPLGIHYPNVGTLQAPDDFYATKWTNFVVLDLQKGAVPELRRRYPDARITMRAYTPDWHSLDPEAWARQIAGWAIELRSYTSEWTFANEQNLAGEGHPLGAPYNGTPYPPRQLYEEINAWNLRVIRELRLLCPWMVIHWPALSQGHSDDQDDGTGYVGFEICRPSIMAADILDLHTYWNVGNPAGALDSPWYGQRYAKLHALFPDKPLYISEFGGTFPDTPRAADEYKRWLDALPSYLCGAAAFIWDSDAPNARWRIYNSPLVPTFKAYAVPTSPPPPPPPPDTGWYPFAVKRPLTVHNYWSGHQPRRAVVLHIAEGPLSAIYPTFNGAQQVSTHFAVGKDGTIEQYVSIDDSAWGNGDVAQPTWPEIINGVNPNLYTISVEHEGHTGETWTAAEIAADAKLLQWLRSQGEITRYVPRHSLIGHWEVDPVNRPNCPGTGLNYEQLAALGNGEDWPPQPPPVTDTVIDPEITDRGIRLDYHSGRQFFVEQVWAQLSDALPVDQNEEPESRNIPQIVVEVYDGAYHPVDDVVVIMATSPTDVAATTTIGGRTNFDMDSHGFVFDPKKEQGPATITVCAEPQNAKDDTAGWVHGFGDPNARHWLWVVRMRKAY